ncbi:Hint domain-containing protein [Rhodobacteraceae bacterium CCMM004]|nr:Hint domain-containing protein [Rhodobacteraceae bacterium CCMM004]
MVGTRPTRIPSPRHHCRRWRRSLLVLQICIAVSLGAAAAVWIRRRHVARQHRVWGRCNARGGKRPEILPIGAIQVLTCTVSAKLWQNKDKAGSGVGAGYRGAFVLGWAQTEIDGLTGAPETALVRGAAWRWRGTARRVDGPDDVLALGLAEGAVDLRRRAARTVSRLMGGARFRPRRAADTAPAWERTATLTDGRRRFTMALIAAARGAGPLVMFEDGVPPPDTDLWVVETQTPRPSCPKSGWGEGEVVCFARGTRIATPDGPRAVEHLTAGDRVATLDDGAQPILWTGSRQITAARLFAMPDLRPVRIRAGALGGGAPPGDLVVSPRHRILLRGRAAQALFGEAEVLVAARALIDERRILVDHETRGVDYFHLLLPRHQVVWANGVACETFQPSAAALAGLDPARRAALAACRPEVVADPARYGPPARRVLDAAEAAILLYARGAH